MHLSTLSSLVCPKKGEKMARETTVNLCLIVIRRLVSGAPRRSQKQPGSTSIIFANANNISKHHWDSVNQIFNHELDCLAISRSYRASRVAYTLLMGSNYRYMVIMTTPTLDNPSLSPRPWARVRDTPLFEMKSDCVLDEDLVVHFRRLTISCKPSSSSVQTHGKFSPVSGGSQSGGL